MSGNNLSANTHDITVNTDQAKNDPDGFSARVAERLEALNRNYAWLSRETGISTRTLSDMRTKGRTPPADRAIAIAKALKVDLEWLATGATASRDALDSRAADTSAYDRELLDCAARLSVREKNALLMMARTLAGDIDAGGAPRTLHGHPNPYRPQTDTEK